MSISFGPWRGNYVACLRTDEFAKFREELAELDSGQRTQAMFAPMEPWLQFTLRRDGAGHLTLEGEAGPEHAGRMFDAVTLEFQLDQFLDQTYVPRLIAELDAIDREFPVIGSRTD